MNCSPFPGTQAADSVRWPSPGGDMKKTFVLFAVISCVLLVSMHATTKPEYQPATVVSVENHETPSNYAGSNPSDAPLQSVVYSYDIGIRLGCTVYRTRYDSAFDYLPSVFAPNHAVEVNLRKRVMDVSLPGDRTLRMGIDGRRSVKDESCMVRN
jgi:uncharacterized protein involved in exopolysaccharide biosynthesis